jgi:hypothetical protein
MIDFQMDLQRINEELRLEDEQLQAYSHVIFHHLSFPIST